MPAFAPERLFTGDQILENAVVHVKDGRVVEITIGHEKGALELAGTLGPGFIDVQVNGGGGVLFNDAPTQETLRTIASAHRLCGVTGVMATLISDDRAKTRAALEAVGAAIEANDQGIIGLHLEGPWLSNPKRGVHPDANLRDFDAEDLALLARAHRFPVMVTVAPERISIDAVETLSEAGVIVALGHTAADAETIASYLKAGARGFTHLFNAMPPLEGRNPGAVGAAFADPEAWAGLIMDGVHVHPISARAALSAKTSRRLMLVSDAMATVGAPSPDMKLFGEAISVKDGALRTAQGTLAGAHLDLAQAVQNALQMMGASETDALRMATLTPAEFLGVDETRGIIAPGARADFVLLDKVLDVHGVWVAEEV